MFGKLKHHTKTICPMTKADNEKAGKCLEFINLYCELSILRQMIMVDISSLTASVGLNATAKNLLNLIDSEQNHDKQIVKFLLNPINHV